MAKKETKKPQALGKAPKPTKVVSKAVYLKHQG